MIPACRGPAQKNRLKLCAETEHVGPALQTLVVGFVKYNKVLCFFWGALCCAPRPICITGMHSNSRHHPDPDENCVVQLRKFVCFGQCVCGQCAGSRYHACTGMA